MLQVSVSTISKSSSLCLTHVAAIKNERLALTSLPQIKARAQRVFSSRKNHLHSKAFVPQSCLIAFAQIESFFACFWTLLFAAASSFLPLQGVQTSSKHYCTSDAGGNCKRTKTNSPMLLISLATSYWQQRVQFSIWVDYTSNEISFFFVPSLLPMTVESRLNDTSSLNEQLSIRSSRIFFPE